MDEKEDKKENRKEFDKYQKKWNVDNVEIDRFNWQTKNPVIVEKEKSLNMIIKERKGTMLEVGCGEGANSITLNIPKQYTGCDYSNTRIEFAKKHGKGRFVVSDGTKLIFRNNSFDTVFCRDVIHHVGDRQRLLSEMYRVCKKNGSVILVESNAYNPVNIGFSLLFKKEHDMRKITPGYVKRLMSKFHGDLDIGFSEAYNLDRLFFHYKMGFSGLAKFSIFRIANDVVNFVFETFQPSIFSAYMLVELKKK